MLFHSVDYLLFLPVVALAFRIIPQHFRWILILGASYFFYASWRIDFSLLLAFSCIADYVIGHLIFKTDHPKKRKLLLYSSLCINLGLLCYFKYVAFGWLLFGTVATHTGLIQSFTPLDIILPLGISFYTFQTLSYTIDIYKRRAKPEPHLGYFACYVTYFPQLLAGPIERANKLIPQLKNPAPCTLAMAHTAMGLLLLGYFKKLVMADRLNLFTQSIRMSPDLSTPLQVVLTPIATIYQYYCDFSGYADLAVGSALLMGIYLTPNFRRPFASTLMTQLWFRWHITATIWFRDYLLVPLSGRKGRSFARRATAQLLTGVFIGLWHGASVGWLITGIVIGALAIFEGLVKKYVRTNHIEIKSRIYGRCKKLVLHIYVLFCFMFIIGVFVSYDSMITLPAALAKIGTFSLADLHYTSWMQSLESFGFYNAIILGVSIIGLEIWQWAYNTPEIHKKEDCFKLTHYIGYMGLAFAILMLGVQSRPDFIYFQF
jgi:D-alanyl-lipoteichoic acid acyltransferase DltB (MBOAT superfamily)